MNITEKDVGRKVVNGFGKVMIIRGFYSDRKLPVLTNRGSYRSDGTFNDKLPYYLGNLVDFADDDLDSKIYTFGQAIEYIAKNPSSEFVCTSCDELSLVFSEDMLCYMDFTGRTPLKNIGVLDMGLTYRRRKRPLVFKTVSELMDEGFVFKTHGFVKNNICIELCLVCELGKDVDPTETQPFSEKEFKAITREK